MRPYFLWICISLLAQPVVAQTCRDDIPASTPDSRFTVNGEEVTDHVTGLVWQRCSLGQTGSDCSGGNADTHSWHSALQTAEAERTATGLAWRLPNRNELQSIVERRCAVPAVNASVFPNAASWYYWSGSPNAFNSSDAWNVYFYSGYSGDGNKGYNYYVRLVRDGE